MSDHAKDMTLRVLIDILKINFYSVQHHFLAWLFTNNDLVIVELMNAIGRSITDSKTNNIIF